MSGLRAISADLDALRGEVAARLAEVWAAITELRADRDAHADQIQSAVEEAQALRTPSDVDLPSPPRGFAEQATQIAWLTRFTAEIARRVAVLEGGATPVRSKR